MDRSEAKEDAERALSEARVERVARALDECGCLGVSLAFTEPQANDTETIRRCRISDTERAMSAARIAIKAMAPSTASAPPVDHPSPASASA